MNTIKHLIIVLLFVQSYTIIAQIKLPKLISDGVVLQRNENVKIWGWASPNENIVLLFKNEKYTATSDQNGNWQIILPAQKAGGPYDMLFKARNEIKVRDILFGDVWVCSGQSNMEIPMERVKERYENVIQNANNPQIRHFLVPDTYNFKKEQDDLASGNWVSTTPENVLNFSAVAYFFALEIYKKQQIPIGLINSALGGSPIESWLSEDALKAFPKAYAEAQKFKNDDLIKSIIANDKKKSQDWYNLLNSKDKGIAIDTLQWYQTKIDDSDWEQMKIPGFWANASLGFVNGVVWFRKEIDVPESMIDKPVKFFMGRIVDQDFVYVNGELVGTTGYQYPPRRYNIKPGLLKAGKNTIAVRVINNSGKGGFVFDKPYYLAVGNDTIALKGAWKYKLGATMKPAPQQTFIRWKPGGLFNAMIAPLLDFKIKGVLWYQGESNTNAPKMYAKTLPTLINSWRSKWNQGHFPFLFVQLPNFMKPVSEPSESNWAQLRQSQLEALHIDNTGMAVAIDLGEWNDIHPLNKKSVGHRLSLLARKIAYGETKIHASSPEPFKTKFKNDKIIISFKNIGSGLMAKNDAHLNSFSISNDGKNFVWANAIIKNNKIIVSNNTVTNPTVVRYAWANNPSDANLYNKEGLPSTPFEIKKSN